MQNNNFMVNKLCWIYLTGFFIILASLILTIPPWFYPADWGKTLLFRSIVAIIGFLLVCQILWKKIDISEKIKFLKKSKIAWALLALFVVFLLSSIFSVDINNSFWASPYRGGGFVTFAFYMFFAVVAFLLLDKKDWDKVWFLSICVGLFISLVALIQFYSLFNNIFVSADSRPSSTLGNPIFLAIYLVLLFFPTLSFAIREKNIKLKVFYIFSLIIFTYAIFIAASRAAYLGLLIGAIYFLLFYSKKYKVIKASSAVLLAVVIFSVYYININPQFAQLISQNRTINSAVSRLSIAANLKEERFSAWTIAAKAVRDRPILGYGMENISVGFDKYYDPNVVSDSWWDRAHSIFLDTMSNAGILGLIAYLSLFAVLFWKLYKIKSRWQSPDKIEDSRENRSHRGSAIESGQKNNTENNYFLAHGIFASLIGYFIANIFSFDSFASYLIFFFLISYTLYLSYLAEPPEEQTNKNINYNNFLFKYKNIFISILFILLIVFLWQYNFVPFQINGQINIANNFANANNCDASLPLMKNLKLQKSFIDSYLIAQYITALQQCATVNPGQASEYAVIGYPLLKEAVKIQPLYTRFWLFLGSYATVIANQTTDQTTKDILIKEAIYAFDRAELMSPKHQEILTQKTKIDMVSQNYQRMKEDAQKCIDIGDIKDYRKQCYWIKGLSELYLKDEADAQKDIETAKKLGLNDSNVSSLYQLVDVYSKTEQYDKLVQVYKKLVAIDYKVPEYHSSLAFTYYKLGQYQKAREEALIFLQLMPKAKAEVDVFLKILPY